MSQLRSTKQLQSTKLYALITFFVLLLVPVAKAESADSHEAAPADETTAVAPVQSVATPVKIAPDVAKQISAPCGVIEDFGGRTQVLDATRTQLLDTDVRVALPCGAWVSTEDGWARIVHRDGYRIHVGSGTFVELLSNETANDSDGDHLVLYRGQIKLQAGSGTSVGEVRVSTPHARARLKRGKALLIFSQVEQETQLIALDHWATLENRFEPARRVKANEGESTSLNFKALRVVPSLPQAVSVASLRNKLLDLRLDDRAKGEAALVVKQRRVRHFASQLSADPTRKPAALQFEGKNEYRRHPPANGDEEARDLWTRRLVGEVQDGEKILHPDRFYGRPSEVKIVVRDVDPAAKRKTGRTPADDEKDRLLKELSQIRVE